MKTKILFAALVVVTVTACSTTGHFKVPPNTQLYVYKRDQPVNVQPDGTVTTKPFFWTAAGIPPESGIPYRLERNGQTVQQGNLRAKFRGASIFCLALCYPMGFNPNITYDLVNNTQR